MQRLILSLCVGALALGLAAAASAQTPAPARQCFSSLNIRGVQPVGDKQVNVRVGLHDVFRIDLASPCPGLNQPQRTIELSPVASATSLCSPADITLAANVQGSRFECFISKVSKLTPEQVAALPNREKP